MPFPPSGRPLAYDADVARALILRIMAGEEMRELWRDATLPSRYTLIAWRRGHPDFAAALRAAVRFARSRARIAASRHDQEAALQEVCDRVLHGEAVRNILQDPRLPAWSTFRDWLRTRPHVREALVLAREMYARTAVERLEDWAAPLPLEAGRVVELQVRQLRWELGRLAAKRYGDDHPELYEDETVAGRRDGVIYRFLWPEAEEVVAVDPEALAALEAEEVDWADILDRAAEARVQRARGGA